jgi:hypothetical protein
MTRSATLLSGRMYRPGPRLPVSGVRMMASIRHAAQYRQHHNYPCRRGRVIDPDQPTSGSGVACGTQPGRPSGLGRMRTGR